MIEKVKIDKLLDLLRLAGDAIIEIYNQNFSIDLKPDHTPITSADYNSNRILVQGLLKLFPGTPVISEENEQVPYSRRKNWPYFWLVDPLDGTKEFIKKNGEFAINLALIEGNRPVLGIIHIPVSNTSYYGQEGKGCYKVTATQHPVLLKPVPDPSRNKVTIAGSRSYLSPQFYSFVNGLRKQYKDVDLVRMGSAIKFALIAEGRADLYLRTGRTMEWDTAAGQIIVAECGKQVYDYKTGQILRYNKARLINPWFLVR